MRFFFLQFLFAAHLVFLQLDEDAIFSTPDKVDVLSVLCTKDHPEMNENNVKNVKCACVSVTEAELLLGLGLPRLDAQFADVDLAAAPPV